MADSTPRKPDRVLTLPTRSKEPWTPFPSREGHFLASILGPTNPGTGAWDGTAESPTLCSRRARGGCRASGISRLSSLWSSPPGDDAGKQAIARRLGATSPAAAKFTGETDLYGALAVKGHRCVNPGHSRAAGRSPAILGGRARQLSAACPPTSTPQGSAAGWPARCCIPVADRSARPPLPPTVLAGTGCVRSVLRGLAG